MAVFMVTDPDSGRKVRLTGASPPTEAELDQIFSTLPPLREPTPREKTIGALETGAVVASSVLAEPAAGIAGLATGVLTQDPAAAAAVVEGVRERLTLEPRTQEAQENIQAIGEMIAPVGALLTGAEDVLGEATLEATGSPGAAAIAATIPTALLELGGAAVFKGVSKLKTGRELSKAIERSTPSVDELFEASRTVFREIDDIGATVKPEALESITKGIERAARGSGGRPRTTPATFGVIDEFKDIVETGQAIQVDELMELRTVANNVAKTIDPAQKAPAVAVIDEIDTFLDRAGTKALNIPEGAPNIGKEYRAARQIWGRARRGELLEEAFVKARDTASGFENGLRIEFRKLLKNKRQSKFFNADEKKAMKAVSEGTRPANLAKLIGRLGFSEGQAINIVNPLIGGAAGAALFGAPGGVAVPIIGQVSKQLAQRLTKGNGRFAQQVVRAGNNSQDIAKAYVRNTPKAQRSAIELSELFIRNEVDLRTASSALAKDAADLAQQARVARIGAVTAGTLKPEEE